MVHVHFVDRSLSKKFLKEGRRDPVSGDPILEGDRIVYCKGCKSAFTLDSWDFMGRAHCQQEDTLVEVNESAMVEMKIEQPWWKQILVRLFNKKEQKRHSKLNPMNGYASLSKPLAYYNLGVFFEKNGREYDQALEWYEKAISLGSIPALFRAACLYLEGKGCVVNPVKATEYLEVASSYKNTDAMLLLGWLYEKGKGCERSMERAVHYYTLAGELGNSRAKKYLKRVQPMFVGHGSSDRG